jgi:hypothetical protein
MMPHVSDYPIVNLWNREPGDSHVLADAFGKLAIRNFSCSFSEIDTMIEW